MDVCGREVLKVKVHEVLEVQKLKVQGVLELKVLERCCIWRWITGGGGAGVESDEGEAAGGEDDVVKMKALDGTKTAVGAEESPQPRACLNNVNVKKMANMTPK